MVDSPADPARLNGCGLFVVNPPWTLQAEAEALLPALASRLARERYGAFRCETLEAH
jgi:23S rRNA (adenine2030-N6)-methyltransferase